MIEGKAIMLRTLIDNCLPWLGKATVHASLLVGLVLFIQWVFQNRLSPRWRFALWWLVIIRLILPVFPTSSLSIYNFSRFTQSETPRLISSYKETFSSKPRMESGYNNSKPEQLSRQLTAPNVVGNSSGQATKHNPIMAQYTPSKPLSFQEWLVLLWLLGVIVLGIRLVCGVLLVHRQLRSGQSLCNPSFLTLLDECRQIALVNQPLKITVTSGIQGPALFGFWRIHLLLPERIMESFSTTELRCILFHELAHIRRKDIWLNWLISMLQILHWFNPILWVGFSRMRTDREMACDALALSFTRGEDCQSYGETIIRLWEGITQPVALPGLVGVLENKFQMQRRIQMIAQFTTRSRGSTWAIFLFIALGWTTLTDANSKTTIGLNEAETKAKAELAVSETGQSMFKSNAFALSKEINDIVDEKTGLKYSVSARVTGKNDIINHHNKIRISPNGKFLLFWGQVVPLSGDPTFILDQVDGEAAWSPDGTKIAFENNGLWILPVSPETARPTSPAKRLVSSGDIPQGLPGRIFWKSNSEKILFVHYDNMFSRAPLCVSINDGKITTFIDYTEFGIQLPDRPDMVYAVPGQGSGLWLKTLLGGDAKNISGSKNHYFEDLCWFKDNQWLIHSECSSRYPINEFHFINPTKGIEFMIAPPTMVGQRLGVSSDHEKLWFYQSSYDYQQVPKIMSARDGSFGEFKTSSLLEYIVFPQWSSDSKTVFVEAGNEKSDDYWAINRVTGTSVRLNIEAASETSTKLVPLFFSPDVKRILLGTAATFTNRIRDIYVAPYSLEQGRVSGPAALVFKGWDAPGPGLLKSVAWSPDGNKLAFWHYERKTQREGIWITSLKGESPEFLCEASGTLNSLAWSYDAKMLVYHLAWPENVLCLVSVDGGQPKKLLTKPLKQSMPFSWSKSNEEIYFASNSIVLAYAILDGKTRQVIDLKEQDNSSVAWLSCSPNGKTLALQGNSGQRLMLYRFDSNKIEFFDKDPAPKWDFCWSPDSEWIYYTAEQPAKVRPAGIIREVKIQDVLQQYAAGKIKATTRNEKTLPGPKLGNSLLPSNIREYVDTFSEGLSPYWAIWEEASLPSPYVHKVEKGELVLRNSRVSIGRPEWKDYVVTVRICFDKIESYGSGAGLSFRRIANDTYAAYVFSPLAEREDMAPKEILMWLGYRDPLNNHNNAWLQKADYPFLLNHWHTLKLEVQGKHLHGYVDGKSVVEVDDERLTEGFITLQASRGTVRFDDFKIKLLP